jgi:hypothetical protein
VSSHQSKQSKQNTTPSHIACESFDLIFVSRHFVLVQASRIQCPCKVDAQFKDGSSVSKCQCKLSSDDATWTGNLFVDIEELGEEDLLGVVSGASSLFVEQGVFANGKLTIPPGATKTIKDVAPRGPPSSLGRPDNKKQRSLATTVSTRYVLAMRVVALDASPTNSLNRPGTLSLEPLAML